MSNAGRCVWCGMVIALGDGVYPAAGDDGAEDEDAGPNESDASVSE